LDVRTTNSLPENYLRNKIFKKKATERPAQAPISKIRHANRLKEAEQTPLLPTRFAADQIKRHHKKFHFNQALRKQVNKKPPQAPINPTS
jgi:hypothetical protein